MIIKLLFLITFGIAFAFVESSVVFYLRQLLNYDTGYLQDGYQVLLDLGFIAFVSPNSPLLRTPYITQTEIMREFFTMVMLVTISYLAGQNLRQRIGAFLISFAIWDLFYYVFLKLLAGWPKSFFDIDVYFLIPIPWIGPVITPVIISILLLVIGSIIYVRKITESKASKGV